MSQSGTKKRSRKKRLSSVNPNAAGIDVGSQFHVVAVPEDRDGGDGIKGNLLESPL